MTTGRRAQGSSRDRTLQVTEGSSPGGFKDFLSRSLSYTPALVLHQTRDNEAQINYTSSSLVIFSYGHVYVYVNACICVFGHISVHIY